MFIILAVLVVQQKDIMLRLLRAMTEHPFDLHEHYHFDGLGVQAGADGADEDCEQSECSDDEYRYSDIAVRLAVWLLPAPPTRGLKRKKDALKLNTFRVRSDFHLGDLPLVLGMSSLLHW